MVPADQSDVAIAGASGDVTSTVPTDQTSENVFLNTLDTVQGVTTPTVAPQPQGFNLVQSSQTPYETPQQARKVLLVSTPQGCQLCTCGIARFHRSNSQGSRRCGDHCRHDAAIKRSHGDTRRQR